MTADTPNVVFVVPGVGGDGSGYDALRHGLRDGGVKDNILTVTWGAPLPLFFLNFQTDSIHHSAEAKLRGRIIAWQDEHPGGTVSLVGHSAGCGVVLGAIASLGNGRAVKMVVLLAPSVSPGYDLRPALEHVSGVLHAFLSDRDTVFLDWRTSTFGSYDNVKTKAAGNLGFTSAEQLPADLRAKVEQHAYEPAWEAIGNDGGHSGTLSRPFATQVLAPLLP